MAILPSGVPTLNRDEALEFLRQLVEALTELRKLRAQVKAWLTLAAPRRQRMPPSA